MAYKRDNSDEKFEAIVACFAVLFAIVFGIIECANETNDLKQHGKEMYECVILEKYDNIGSTWHLIGGRASETEYHIVYKIKCTNRPDDKYKSTWRTEDDDVNYVTYRHYEVGKTYKTEYNWLPGIH